jgi:hypothetical protein
LEIRNVIRIYEVQGKGTDSGRTRTRQYKATSAGDARRQAEAAGTTIDTITDLGPEPPTEHQIAYANSLGIGIPEGATFADVSCMITNAVHNEEPAPKADMALASAFGLKPPSQYMNREELAGFIYHHLDSSQLVQWYLYLVFKRRANQRVQKKVESPVDPELVRLAREMGKDPKVLESIRKQGRFLLDGVAPDQTRAYKEAIRALGPILGVTTEGHPISRNATPAQSTVRQSPTKTGAQPDKSTQPSGAFLALIIVLVFLLWFFW